ncbi:MAG TPA: Gfo/Idh/MocA family oxidoreductase, partial [Pseudonocardia sp.]
MNPPAADGTTTFAMVGTGWMAAAIAPDFASCGFARLTTVVSRSRDRADAFATKFGVTATATIEELPALDVDVVYIATPHHNHAELACAALEAGKHVLLEKAFTMDAAEARHVAQTALAHDRFLMEAMWMRFNPAIRRAHELLLAGSIGEPRTLQASFGRAVPYDRSHRLWDPARGGGSVLDQGVYPITLADLVFGPPATVA